MTFNLRKKNWDLFGELSRLDRNVQMFFLIRLPRHNWPKSWANIEDPVVPLERNLYGHPLAGIAMGKTIRRSFVGAWMGESTELGMPVRSSETGYFCQFFVDDIKNGWKEAECGSHVEEIDEKRGH